ncbi:MAG: serine O-acetyltransferase EpsC [Polyangiales bacterium]
MTTVCPEATDRMPTASVRDATSRAMESVAHALASAYAEPHEAQRYARHAAPSRASVRRLLRDLLVLFYPGYFRPTSAAPGRAQVEVQLTRLHAGLSAQIWRALSSPDHARAAELATELISSLPLLRSQLLDDLHAAKSRDPSARGAAEIILCFPGLLALSIHRVAHRLYALGVPLLPRMMSEWAHAQTGVDIHPGARIGRGVFIDHGTGVVIGETSVVGDEVTIYQGVTLGARSLPAAPHDAARRHPTIGDHVTLCANATVLGGTTQVGRGAIVGAGALVLEDVPAFVRVGAGEIRARSPRAACSGPRRPDVWFQI